MAAIKRALEDLKQIIHSDRVLHCAQTSKGGFTQTRKISLQDVLLYYVFRSAETTNKDIISYFSKTEKPKVSKQAMFKALDKTDPKVFPMIIHQFADKFYSYNDYATLDGYIVLACDGTHMDLPCSLELAERYGGVMNQFITSPEQIKKPQAKCSVLIDVINHVILDALVEPFNTSELPMLFTHLENCAKLHRGKKVILLCDRYYGSAELFLYCIMHGYDFIVRAPKNLYKAHVCKVECDGDIRVPFNPAWCKRMKRDDCRGYAQKAGALFARVVKSHYEYTSGKGKKQYPVAVDSIYMTSLEREPFPASRIVELYHAQRWDNETAYFDIKNHLEAERFNSAKYNIVTNEIYGKILCFSICGCLYEDADERLCSREKDNLAVHEKIPNMKCIADTVRTEHRFMYYLSSDHSGMDTREWDLYFETVIEDLSRRTVPVRPGRHYKRWGRWMKWIPTNKFRIDGRRNPPIEKCYKTNGYMTTRG